MVPGMLVLGCSASREVSRIRVILRADFAIRGFAISLFALSDVALPDPCLAFL